MRASLVFLFMFIAAALGTFEIYHNKTIHTGAVANDTSNSLRMSIGITDLTFFEVVHCFGELDWFVGLDDLPNGTNPDDISFLWDPDNSGQTFGINVTGTLNFLFVCKNAYPDVCATFDLIIANQSTNISRDVSPDIPNKSVTGSVTSNGGSGQVHFNSTGSPLDTYAVYWQTSSQPKGYYTSTACSVEGWMNQFTSEQGTVTANDDGSYTVDVPNLSGKEFTITVVVNKENGYNNVYDTFILNGDGSVVMPTLVVLFLAVIVSLF